MFYYARQLQAGGGGGKGKPGGAGAKRAAVGAKGAKEEAAAVETAESLHNKRWAQGEAGERGWAGRFAGARVQAESNVAGARTVRRGRTGALMFQWSVQALRDAVASRFIGRSQSSFY
jgi:hypothetical protein